MKTNLQKSKTGPANGPGSSPSEKYVVYQVVGDDDSADTCPNDTGSGNNDKIKQQAIGMNILWGIIIAIAIMGIAWLFRKWVPPVTAAAAAVAAVAVEASPNPAK